MGRAFEFRKERKLKRWGNMARTFTKLGKEITIAARESGTDPNGNARLRSLIQTAKGENMPKDNIERAIRRAVDKGQEDYQEVVYEGFASHGIAVLVETATDNTMRTVANVRAVFNKFGGSLGTSGCVSFMFDHKCCFRVIDDGKVDIDELELELIDLGVDEVYREEKDEDDEDSQDEIVIYGNYPSFGQIQKYLEDHNFEINYAGFERIPNVDLKTLSGDDRAGVDKLISTLEDDEDVQNVYTTLAPEG
ncbi:MAG: YebC/PmpR family DNA-binding transcriptional regulator [Bacteroidales bacterium]|jgi:YebC/PmpR family DNA-binding regulatory protein|nr:YebC/PmpR family DNA-binding transcriptional regulator [Bacteroidales bacterium]MCI2121618.1 YebC/PmpR family DNA-binding transcriptional regulator [Bacteroidales bacterium]MCI2144703.1 YebC/PmpR family DNA-binding transcriptional regulator [Bacteroidales bacterium]